MSDGSRPFLAAVFETMECAENDYLALFALCLIYSMQNNTGESSEPILFNTSFPLRNVK